MTTRARVGMWLALLAVLVALGALVFRDKLHPSLDTNNDGRLDVWLTYDLLGRLNELRKDRNFDGTVDHIETYKNSVVNEVRVDMNNDGRFEVLSRYDDQGRLVTLHRDMDGDGRVDRIAYFDSERQLQLYYDEDSDHDGRMDKRVALSGPETDTDPAPMPASPLTPNP